MIREVRVLRVADRDLKRRSDSIRIRDSDEAAKRSIDTVRAAMTAHDPDATERFARLRVAMDVLRDPIRRATYDTDLLAEQLRAQKTS